ncbi:MAG: VOC family protein [Planctomycetota bacterium]
MPVRNDFAAGEFCWIDLNAHDLEAAAAWYGKLFGWTHQVMPAHIEGAPPYAFFLQGEAVAAGVGQMSDEMKEMGIPPMWNAYVCTEDCEATEAKVGELGGTVTVPTMDIPQHGKLAFFMDPGGASFAAWQVTNPESPGLLVDDHGSLSWVESMTRDKAQAQDFYSGLLGWEFSALEMPGMEHVDYSMIQAQGKDAGGMMVMEGPNFEGVPPHWLVYFAVDDCDATAREAEASGGKILVPPMDIPVGKFSMMSDPQGGTFCVITLTQ